MSIVSAQEPDDSHPLDAQLKVSSSRALAEQSCFDDKVPDYAVAILRPLHSEYLILKPTIADPQLVSLLEDIYAKRLNCKLAWVSDLHLRSGIDRYQTTRGVLYERLMTPERNTGPLRARKNMTSTSPQNHRT